MKPSTFRKFLFFKLPIAWIAGLRLESINEQESKITVKLSKFSQNPFRSMFWAVQGMAGELSTGVLMLAKIQKAKKKVSFLVIEQNGQFYKKATGKIEFICEQGQEIENTINNLTPEQNTNTIKVFTKGYNESGDMVAEFWFLWSLKLKE